VALRTTPVRVDGNAGATDWVAVSTGFTHACGVRSGGALHCWGRNDSGEFGNGTERSSFETATPGRVAGTTRWLSVSGGNGHSCGVRADHTLWCWGNNYAGVLGVGGNVPLAMAPVRVGAATNWAQVFAGFEHTCGVRTSGALYCWGDNTAGQLGNGTTTDRSTPTRVGTATGWLRVTGGYDHTCAVRTTGTLYCWGSNADGQLGVGTTDNKPHSTPVRVGTATGWSAVAAGYSYNCAVRTTGTLYCWGSNFAGQLGNGTTTARPAPTRVGTATGWKAVAAGISDTCAVRTTGTLYCWGDGLAPRTSGGTAPTMPVRIGTATGWVAVAVGDGHACATRTTGTVYCWGSNRRGQVGSDTSGYVYVPTRVGTATGWAVPTAGWGHSCVLRTSGTVYCWGDNTDGQLGVVVPGSVVYAAGLIQGE